LSAVLINDAHISLILVARNGRTADTGDNTALVLGVVLASVVLLGVLLMAIRNWTQQRAEQATNEGFKRTFGEF